MSDGEEKRIGKMFCGKLKTLFRTGFFHIFGSNVINKIISFVSTIVLVRILTKEEYGIFTYSWNIFCLIILFNGLTLESAVLQLCSEHSGNREYSTSITGYCLRAGLIYDLFLSFTIIGIASFIPLKIEGSKELLLYTALLPELTFCFNVFASYFRSQKRNQYYSKILVLNTCLIFVCQVCGALIFREKGMILGSYVSGIVTLIVLIVSSDDTRHIIRNFGIRKIKESRTLLSIGAVSMINNGISQMMYLLDVFVLGIVTSDELVLASYKVATVIPTALTFIPASFVTYIYPYFAEHRLDGKWCLNNYKRILKYISILNAVISGTLIVLAKWIVPLFFGTQYNDAETIFIFRLLSASYFFSGTFRTIAGNLLVTQRKLKFNMLVAVLSGILNAVGDYVLIKIFGARGAAYTTIAVVIFSSLMNVLYLISVLKHKHNESLETREI